MKASTLLVAFSAFAAVSASAVPDQSLLTEEHRQLLDRVATLQPLNAEDMERVRMAWERMGSPDCDSLNAELRTDVCAHPDFTEYCSTCNAGTNRVASVLTDEQLKQARSAWEAAGSPPCSGLNADIQEQICVHPEFAEYCKGCSA